MPMLAKMVVVSLLLASLLGCDKDLVPLVPRLTADGGPVDTGADIPWAYPSWGEYAATLKAVAPCRGDLTLTVNTTTAELDGGTTLSDPAQAGDTLSFYEALTIAANRSERVAIFFDPQVFPPEAPGTIAFDAGCDLPDIENTCIDGRDRGVIIDFIGDHSGGKSTACTLTLRQNALLVGVELRKLIWQIYAHAGSQIAGCRFNSDGFENTIAGEPETLTPTGDALIGPGNTFGNTEGVTLKYGSMARIIGNYFGVDPVTGADLFNQFGVQISSLTALTGTLRIEGNLFRANTGIHIWMGLSTDSRVEIVGNRFEPGNRELSFGGWAGIDSLGGFGGAVIVGPSNHFRDLDVAISLDSPATLTQNTIENCAQTLTLAGAPVGPPTITRATPSFVEGACAVDGLVEIFADDASGQASSYVGDAACSAGSWRYDGTIAHAYVTATLTTTDGTSTLADAVQVQP